jgi:CheY-like chemotaxis protein
MKVEKKPLVILMAEDDEDYYMLTREALAEAHLLNDLKWVADGAACMDYLYRRNEYANPDSSPRPGIILLDLNMPRKNGHEALQEIKSDPDLRQIPCVIMTVSTAEEDILRSYNLGANSYIRKPLGFNQLLDVIRTFNHYWFQIVQLPQVQKDANATQNE